MTWKHIDDQKRHTQDGCQLALLMKKVSPRRRVLAVDIGCGDGIITSEMLRLQRTNKVVAIDISKMAIEVSKENLKEHIGNKKAEVKRVSAKTFFRKKSEWETYNLFVINPPFFVSGSGKENSRKLDQLARHEGSLSLSVWSKGAGKLLGTGGELYCVFPTERLAECLRSLSSAKVEPKEIWWLKDDKRKRRFFLRAIRDGKPGIKIHVDFELKGMS